MPSPSCRPWRCRRSVACSRCWAPTSCSSVRSTTSSCAGSAAASGRGRRSPPSSRSSPSGRTGSGPRCAAASVIVNEVALVRGAPGHHRRHGPGLPRASSRRPAAPTRCASRAARSCRRRSSATCSAADPSGTIARRPAGRPGAGPRPRRRVRLPADGPGRDAGRRPARPGRPPARGRPPEGHRQERLGSGPGAAGRRPRGHGRAHCGPGAGRRRRRSTSPSRPAHPVRPAALRLSRRPALLRRIRREPRHRALRPSRDDQPAHLRPELRLHEPAADRRRGGPGLGDGGAPAGRDRGPGARRHGQHPLLPADAPSRSAARPTFTSDLLRSTVVASDAVFFSKDPTT